MMQFHPTPTIHTPKVVGLTNEDLYRQAPSIFADKPWDQVSENYKFIPTITVLDQLRNEGFYPVEARQGKTRIPGKGDFTQHMIKLRRENFKWSLSEVVPELILLNSHDRTKSFNLLMGLFRFLCLNGMYVGTLMDALKVRHSGRESDNVIEASYRIIDEAPQIQAKVEHWQSLPMSLEQQHLYAERAIGLRWDGEKAPLDFHKLLTLRHYEDKGKNTLWHTYQTCQENLIKGGLWGRDSRNHRRRTRGVKAISPDIAINRGLWNLTANFEGIAAA